MSTSRVADRRALAGGGGTCRGEQEGCRNSGAKPFAASAPKTLPRLAAQLRPQLRGAPRWPFKDFGEWLK